MFPKLPNFINSIQLTHPRPWLTYVVVTLSDMVVAIFCSVLMLCLLATDAAIPTRLDLNLLHLKQKKSKMSFESYLSLSTFSIHSTSSL